MAARILKQITDTVRAWKFVLSAFQEEGDHVAETLTGLTQPNLEETDEVPGYRSVIVGLSRNVNAALDRLVAADLKLASAAAWESSLRQQHGEKSEQMGLTIVALRRTVNGQYVAPDLENLGLQPVDVRDSVTVARRADLVAERFEAPSLSMLLGEPRFEPPVDVGGYVRQIRSSSKELLELGQRINEATRVTARARVEKDNRMAEYDPLFLRSTRVFEDLCRVAGEYKLADQIRATVARSRRHDAEPGDDVPDGADPIGDVADTSTPEGEESSHEV